MVLLKFTASADRVTDSYIRPGPWLASLIHCAVPGALCVCVWGEPERDFGVSLSEIGSKPKRNWE